jgi:hypothetical protein
MKLIEFRVREFRSIWDSGLVKVDSRTTYFVRKSEAGKTALLIALYRTAPNILADAVFDETYDYPKRETYYGKSTASSSSPLRGNTSQTIPRYPTS